MNPANRTSQGHVSALGDDEEELVGFL